jgi:hypothetical protein
MVKFEEFNPERITLLSNKIRCSFFKSKNKAIKSVAFKTPHGVKHSIAPDAGQWSKDPKDRNPRYEYNPRIIPDSDRSRTLLLNFMPGP